MPQEYVKTSLHLKQNIVFLNICFKVYQQFSSVSISIKQYNIVPTFTPIGPSESRNFMKQVKPRHIKSRRGALNTFRFLQKSHFPQFCGKSVDIFEKVFAV